MRTSDMKKWFDLCREKGVKKLEVSSKTLNIKVEFNDAVQVESSKVDSKKVKLNSDVLRSIELQDRLDEMQIMEPDRYEAMLLKGALNG